MARNGEALTTGSTAAMTSTTPSRCASCGGTTLETDSFCLGCGRAIAPARSERLVVILDPPEVDESAEVTRRISLPRPATPPPTPPPLVQPTPTPPPPPARPVPTPQVSAPPSQAQPVRGPSGPGQARPQRSGWDVFESGMSLVMRVAVSLLWGAGGVAAFAAGEPVFGLVAIAYLAYLWVLGGRWLIY